MKKTTSYSLQSSRSNDNDFRGFWHSQTLQNRKAVGVNFDERRCYFSPFNRRVLKGNFWLLVYFMQIIYDKMVSPTHTHKL